jgi:hypothetical protein
MKRLLRIFQFIFGCRHRHLSRVFTIKSRTYRVCFDCGREFDVPDAQAPVSFVIAGKFRSRTNAAMTSETCSL